MYEKIDTPFRQKGSIEPFSCLEGPCQGMIVELGITDKPRIDLLRIASTSRDKRRGMVCGQLFRSFLIFDARISVIC